MMLEFLNRFSFEYRSVITRVIKYLLILTIILYVPFQLYGKRFIYQRMFGTKNDIKQVISTTETYTDLPSDYEQKAYISGYDVDLKLLKHYSVTARVAWVDRYQNSLGRWYRSSGNKGSLIYDKVMEQDLFLAWDTFGRDPTFSKIKWGHEYRAGIATLNSSYANYGDMGNFHSVAANARVQRGLDILKKGDVVTMEGYLLYWRTYVPEEHRYIDFKSAEYAGERHTDQIYNGTKPVLCKQIYITKITFDGYTFE